MRGTASVRQSGQVSGSSTASMPGFSRSALITRAAITSAVKHTSFAVSRRAVARSSAPSGGSARMRSGSIAGARPGIAFARSSTVRLGRGEGAARPGAFLFRAPVSMASASVRRRMRICAMSETSSIFKAVQGRRASSSTPRASSSTPRASSMDIASNPQPNDCRHIMSTLGRDVTNVAARTSLFAGFQGYVPAYWTFLASRRRPASPAMHRTENPCLTSSSSMPCL